MLPTMTTVTLASGHPMPVIGLGTWPMTDEQAAVDVLSALELGYRKIDTAENYENETGVGLAISRSALPRDSLFVTSKFNKKWHSVEGVRQACEASLQRLGLDYLDLLLVHWPNPGQGRYVEAFEGLLGVQQAGLVRSIGTSNFLSEHLQPLFDRGYLPQVNQIQLDPFHTRDDLVALHRDRGIVTEAWSPIGRGGDLLGHPAVTTLAQRHGRTPAQIVLRWHLQNGFVPLPKSSDPTRQAQNLAIFDFELSEAEVASLHLDRPDPEMFHPKTFGH